MKASFITQIFAAVLFCLVLNNVAYCQVATYRQHEAVYKKADSLTYQSYTLKIETYYIRDSVIWTARRLFNPIVIKQKLTFTHHGKVLRQVYNGNRMIYQRSVTGRKIRMLSEVYYLAYAVYGSHQSVFAVGGSGGCNSCPETLDFYSLNGIALKTNSAAEFDTFLKDYGIRDYNESGIAVMIYPFASNKNL